MWYTYGTLWYYLDRRMYIIHAVGLVAHVHHVVHTQHVPVVLPEVVLPCPDRVTLRSIMVSVLAVPC